MSKGVRESQRWTPVRSPRHVCTVSECKHQAFDPTLAELSDDRGTLCVPLYHGTCSVFASDIVRLGLGGANPIHSLKVVEFLWRIAPVCREHLGNVAYWRSQEGTLEHIMAQSVSAGGFNYRHGAAYLSPSEETAAQYAISNPYGSEIISLAMGLFECLESLADQPPIVTELKRERILDLRQNTHLPILVVANEVPLSFLLSETGEDPVETLNTMKMFEEEGFSAVGWQQTNFELTGIIQPTNLTLFEIMPLSVERARPDYTLVPWAED